MRKILDFALISPIALVVILYVLRFASLRSQSQRDYYRQPPAVFILFKTKVRYNSLMKTFPEQAEELFQATEEFAKLRYESYKKLSEM